MIRALIFDFDGLILDTEGPIYKAWVEIYQELGAELPLSAWEAWVGGSPEGFDACGYLESQLGRAVDRETLTKKASKREDELILLESALPGVEEYIADGVIHLTLEEVQERKFQRFLRIVKMRKTAHRMEKYPFQIGPNGLEVLVKG